MAPGTFRLHFMLPEVLLEKYPRTVSLKTGLSYQIRPLRPTDETAFHEFFLAAPQTERMFIKHRVTELKVIRDWCQNIDYGRNLPLLATTSNQIMGVATLHQQLGGWKRHIGRISVIVHPHFRARGIARTLVAELIETARDFGLERLEAEFITEQERAIKVFSLLGFNKLLFLADYVKDMQAISHDYVLMGFELVTDEEYAGMG